MSEEIKTDYCIAGGGIAGVLLAHRLAASGKRIVILEHGPRFTEMDRIDMLNESRTTLNDFADYNDAVSAATTTSLSSAEPAGQVVDWMNYRLFGLGGTALHFEGRHLVRAGVTRRRGKQSPRGPKHSEDQQQSHRPSIYQNMVEGEDKIISIGVRMNESQAHQWRF